MQNEGKSLNLQRVTILSMGAKPFIISRFARFIVSLQRYVSSHRGQAAVLRTDGILLLYPHPRLLTPRREGGWGQKTIV